MSYGPSFGFNAPIIQRSHVALPGFSGARRIAHLTDLHFGSVTPIALQKAAVALTNGLQPDLTVLTGDFVARGRRYLDRMSEVLVGLQGDKIAVLGNHDHWVDARGVQAALERAGVEVLSNGWTTRGSGEDTLVIVGLDDFGTQMHDVERATRRLGDRPTIALSHNPEAAPLLWERGAGLVLSGHTHGGQVYVRDWTRTLYENVLKIHYIDGWYANGHNLLYVNPGVGASVVPWRVGRPAMRTVAILEVQGAQDGSAR